MTLLSVANDTCDVVGIARPAGGIVSNTNDQLARQILGLAKKTLEELGHMSWPILDVPYSFNSVVGQAEYDLPSDFDRETGDTLYVAGQYMSLRGSLTPADWQRQRSGLQVNLGRPRFRIFGLPRKLVLTPTPTTIQSFTMEYRTTFRVQQADATYKNTFFADDDTILFPEELLKQGLEWRLRRVKGLDYSEEFDAYEVACAQLLAQALAMGSMPVAYRSGVEFEEGIAVPYMPEAGFGQ